MCKMFLSDNDVCHLVLESQCDHSSLENEHVGRITLLQNGLHRLLTQC